LRSLVLGALLFSIQVNALAVVHPKTPRVSVRTKEHTSLTRKQRLRHPFWHPMFPPTHESLIRQNAEIDRLGLARMYDQDDIDTRVQQGILVPLPLSDHLTVDPHLPENRRYCLPLAAKFLTDLSDKFYARFGEPLRVNSAIRNVEFQKRLRRYNHNAAPFDGEAASSHLAGLTVDLERKRLSKAQVQWVDLQLLILHSYGMVEVEEEYYQLCFHVMVLGRYAEPFVDVQTATVDTQLIEESDADPR